MTEKQAVAKKAESLPVNLMDDLYAGAGQGTENMTSEDMQIPFMRILQPLSPQLIKTDSKFIKGASAGDIFNNVTGQFWPGEDGITVVPCYQVTKYLEFTPREQGGGFRGEIPANDPILTRTTRNGSKEILPTGNELVKSDQHYCLVVEEDGSFQPVVVDMKSTQLKVSRRWKTQIAMQKVKHPKTGQMLTPPVYATQWKLTTVEESNDQGSWANYTLEKVGLVENRDLLLEAKAFRESVAAGEVKAAKDPDNRSLIQL